ncbi:UDP-glucose 4-epimerase GalE [Entomomonas asaccharolytica]|uniref:UDP-glucose 4-epimerase n=1 Tax=Entomomonas asaccharolytica TaxID=2785331 RepID=A0A974RXX5_9GAMM|nr:UDP-glucose 4-epimerase GalE [Entomomonas asaccharolytica]QQP86660.1 UDP-glucose 4-epimerase GalE [Entomomonas asaccharolytica]
MRSTVLVTGGAGYIGSHTCVLLLEAGYSVVVVDNLSNSNYEAINRVQKITGKTVHFIEGDVRDISVLNKVFAQYKIDAVIHFAGLKSVSESIQKPIEYYDNNINSTLVLCQAMREAQLKNLVFSSSATVYGDPQGKPASEDFAVGGTTNPYGTSKLMLEQILTDIYRADNSWNIALLRYFNPVGAHPSGLIGEDPTGIPNNLMPYIAQVAVGMRPYLNIYGDDYPTHDGTGVRDYIHVMDLAKGHVSALQWLQTKPGIRPINLGTGVGYSVLDMLHAFEKACGKKLDYKIIERRAGDVAICYSDSSLAKQLLNWQTQYSLEDMCKDTWHWQSKNPNGYR